MHNILQIVFPASCKAAELCRPLFFRTRKRMFLSKFFKRFTSDKKTSLLRTAALNIRLLSAIIVSNCF